MYRSFTSALISFSSSRGHGMETHNGLSQICRNSWHNDRNTLNNIYTLQSFLKQGYDRKQSSKREASPVVRMVGEGRKAPLQLSWSHIEREFSPFQ